MRVLAILGGAVAGGVLGYFIGAIAGCDWLIPDSNLCGLYGMMLTGPIGCIAGGIAGWRLSRPKPA